MYRLLIFVTAAACSINAYAFGDEANCHTPSSLELVANQVGPAAKCLKVLESPACQAVYKEIRSNNLKSEDFALECSTESALSAEAILSASGRSVAGCIFGLVDGAVGVTGRFIGETAAAIVTDYRVNKECNKSIDNKKRLYTIHNASVEKKLQLAIPEDNILNTYDCSDLRLSIFNEHRYKTLKLARERNQTINSNPNINIIAAAQNILDQQKINWQCYNSEKRAAMICEAISFVGVNYTLLSKVQKLSKLSGLKLTRVAESTSAEAVAVSNSGLPLLMSKTGSYRNKFSNLAKKSNGRITQEDLEKLVSPKLMADTTLPHGRKIESITLEGDKIRFGKTKQFEHVKNYEFESIEDGVTIKYVVRYHSEDMNRVIQNGVAKNENSAMGWTIRVERLTANKEGEYLKGNTFSYLSTNGEWLEVPKAPPSKTSAAGDMKAYETIMNSTHIPFTPKPISKPPQ